MASAGLVGTTGGQPGQVHKKMQRTSAMLAIWYVATSNSCRACCKVGMANEKKKEDQLSFSMQSCDESWHGSNDLAGGPEVMLKVLDAAAVHVGLGAEVLGLGRDGHALHLVHP